MSNQGTIVQVIGAVVDADFSKATALPGIYNALEVTYDLNGVPTKLVLEVQQHLGDGWVRTVAMSASDGLKRGMVLTDTGKPIAETSVVDILSGADCFEYFAGIAATLAGEHIAYPGAFV